MANPVTHTIGQNEPVFSVSEVNASVKELLSNTFPVLTIEGEMSDFYEHRRSGHWYFTLKDENSILQCVMFARDSARVRYEIEDGMLVQIRATLSIYEQRGAFQAYVRTMEPAGEGALRQAFELLRAKLQEAGWFDESLKKPLPPFPKHIAVVSSAEADATRDVITNISRRYPIVKLTLVESSVQGKFAAKELSDALSYVNQMSPRPDFAIVTRGGGSLEDLAVFNSEAVAKAIYESDVPVVSAVGHEADYTIADFVADLRAPTPSTAAELVTPDSENLYATLENFKRSLSNQIHAKIRFKKNVLDTSVARLRDPRKEIEMWQGRSEELGQRLTIVMLNRMANFRTSIEHATQLLLRTNPSTKISDLSSYVSQIGSRLSRSVDAKMNQSQTALSSLGKNLQAVSPLGVLDRGYAVVSKPDGSQYGAPVKSVQDVAVGDSLQAHVSDGSLDVSVTQIKEQSRD